ncbi:MAG: hypothetical protein JSV22_09060 [Bacteroidales bacterium]|nr:MAG: hypothetical protein JSV22_09060 [Bacteroidales bacterium]
MKNKTSIIEIDPKWNFSDYFGSVKVRLSIGRNNYRIVPGLYKLGDPDKLSDIFVTANYKLSFDLLRRNLEGRNAWILVLNTRGINVWCAAGKGTFGTRELIKRINLLRLSSIVSHRRLILPQLGAPGVASHIIREETGFNIKYGPVRASDIGRYIENGYKATEIMRRVQFNFKDRILITPVEIMSSLWQISLVIIVFIALSGVSSSGYSLESVMNKGLKNAFIILIAYLSGTFLTPTLLPWLPSRYFAGKGIFIQTLVFLALIISGLMKLPYIDLIAWFLISIALTSFLAMNFTGASTYTSLSGVKKEMRLFIPVQLTAVITGFVLYVISKFV